MTYSTDLEFAQPVLQYHDRVKLWRLLEDYTFEWGPGNFRKRIFIAAGLEYDKASVPRILWPIARPDGPWEGASLYHDRACRDEGSWTPGEFHFETRVRGAWRMDQGRWRAGECAALFGYMGRCADAPMPGPYEWAVRLFGPRW